MFTRRLIGPLLLAAASLTGCAVHEEVVVARPYPYYYSDSYYAYGPAVCYSGPIVVGGYYRPYYHGYYGRWH